MFKKILSFFSKKEELELSQIDLQNKTSAQIGRIEKYFFENENIGLKKTLFHRIDIPLLSFDSGLEDIPQETKTEISFSWYSLELDNPDNLDGLNLNHKNYPNAEASVYIGWAHNWCHVNEFILKKISENKFHVSVDLLIDFESEGVALNEKFTFQTELLLNKNIFNQT